MSVRLVQTCGACPEQYDVFDDDEQIGYLRLRHGHFTASEGSVHGETVYAASTLGDGNFEDEERAFHLNRAVAAILDFRKGIDSEEILYPVEIE